MGCTSSKAAEANEPASAAKSGTTAPQASSSKPAGSDLKPAVKAVERKSSGKEKKAAIPVAESPKPSSGPVITDSGPAEGKQLREATEKPKIIFVIGGPGSGKGTQCAKIVKKYGGGVRHISSGDLLRAEVSKGSELGQELEKTMKAGSLVSDEQVIQLLENEISTSAWFGMAYLVDGFPRAVPQAEKFERKVREADLVLYFECPEKVMKERILERGKTSGRQDDNEKTVKDRMQTFKKQSLPVVKHYSDQDKLKEVSAVPPPDEVFEKVSVILEEFFEGSTGKANTKQEEVDQWRTPHVLDMQKRFYGGLQDEEIESTPAEGLVDPATLPPVVNAAQT